MRLTFIFLLIVLLCSNTIGQAPTLSISGSNSACEATFLTAISNSSNISWSTGDFTPSIVVTETGWYSATATNLFGSTSDSIHVEIGNYLSNNFLGNDTILCGNITLEINDVSGPVLWSTGIADSILSISQSGNISVIVIDNGCLSYDTINISIDEPIEFSLQDVSLCTNNTVTIEGPTNVDSYLWSTGEQTSTIIADSSGKYFLTITKGTCIQEFQVYVDLESGVPNYAIPSAFTPNNDNQNDCFSIVGDVTIIIFKIFNRYGN
ncbi:MAG: gliding motility-associated C-terminal domain-containing protein [Chitinophagales bacterium]